MSSEDSGGSTAVVPSTNQKFGPALPADLAANLDEEDFYK